MSVKIDRVKCSRCGVCVEVCPGDVLRMDSKKRSIVSMYPDDCWYCGACSADCPEDAIEVVFPYLIR